MSVALTSVETFDPTDAINDAITALAVRNEQIMEQIVRDTATAKKIAEEYAKHLTADGDPTTPPVWDRWGDGRNTIIPARVALDAVYENWNVARGSRNPISPFSSPEAWKIAELVFARFGEPIPLAEIRKVHRDATPDRVAKALVLIAKKTGAAVVPRKTKVAGKVAYYLRERRDGDTDEVTEGGWYRSAPRAGSDITEEKP